MLENYLNFFYLNSSSIFDEEETANDGLGEGNFGIKNTKTNTVTGGKPVKSVTGRITILNSVATLLEKDFFEYLI